MCVCVCVSGEGGCKACVLGEGAAGKVCVYVSGEGGAGKVLCIPGEGGADVRAGKRGCVCACHWGERSVDGWAYLRGGDMIQGTCNVRRNKRRVGVRVGRRRRGFIIFIARRQECAWRNVR